MAEGDVVLESGRVIHVDEYRGYLVAPVEDCDTCDQVGGEYVVCTTCDLAKRPRGRSVPLEASGFCGPDCSGYDQEPDPGDLWPGERYGSSLGHMDWHEA